MAKTRNFFRIYKKYKTLGMTEEKLVILCRLYDRRVKLKQIEEWAGGEVVDTLEKTTIIHATKEENILDKMEKEFGKDWDVPKQTATKEGDEE